MADQNFDIGLELRRKVVGEARIETALNQADAFSLPLQALMTSFAWGQVWSREHLDLRSRSLLTIGMLIALNRRSELEAHLRAGLNNGLTEIEIREAIIHASVYCGFPAALEATKAAQSVFASP